MKYSSIFSCLALVLAVSAASISTSLPYQRGSDVRTRHGWRNEDADYRGTDERTQVMGRGLDYDIDIYERQEGINPQEVEDAVKTVKDLVTGIINIVKFIKGKIERDKKVR